MPVLAYGAWPSSLSAAAVARVSVSGFSFSGVDIGNGRIRWAEFRSTEEGRSAVVEWADGRVADLTPPQFSARTRVHEYGGGAVWHHGDAVFASDAVSGRVVRFIPGSAPAAITPDPAVPHALRYADGCVTPDGATIVCVRERWAGGAVHNELVSFRTDGAESPQVVASGRDLYAAPRLDPTGRRLAWLAWDHPRMPWDGTELWLAEFAPDGCLCDARRAAGGSDESVVDPQWSPEGALYFCSDRNGWWNLCRLEPGGSETPLTMLDDGEIGYPSWVLDQRRYAFLHDRRIACVVTRRAVDSLELLDPETGRLESAGIGWTAYTPMALAASCGTLVFAAASPTEPETLVAWEAATGREERLRCCVDIEFDRAALSLPRPIAFPTGDGSCAHAFFYPPASAECEGPADELPPLRVLCHGGPTSHAAPALNPRTQFYTQRGIGVVDVNYRGSSGYGREYRRLLYGRWGELDWRDCVAAARFLASEREADPERTWVEGISAGGYAVLCSLVFDPTAFAAGVSVCGIADTAALARATHKLESRYIDRMVGASPERPERHRERSPIHFVDRLVRPLLLLQGLDDEIVPPSQAEMMVAALDRERIPYGYLAFAGEGHGLRSEPSLRRALEATLAFVAPLFGLECADKLEPLEIAHL